MKGKKLLALMMAALVMASLLAGCGAATDSVGNMKQESPMEAPEAVMDQEAGGGLLYGTTEESASTAAADQKLIKRVNIDAETEDLESLLPQITNKVGELGGYIEHQELYNGSAYSSSRRRNVNMTIRIPADRLGEFTAQIEGASNVVNYSESAEDVTLQYVDTESRITALEVEQERLLELLSKADNMSDLLEIEARLTDVRYELESYSSQLRTLENKVSYATVYLYINQVKVYTEVEPQTVWQRIGSGFSENLTDIGEDLTNFFVWIVTFSPQLIFWAVVIAGAVTLVRRKAKNRRTKKMPDNPPEKQEEK
ncbi:MAG: DUF4349 domain-containing protein [Oscillospiraceae bacterium]|nr:DUF4349 domain-containing protein [Oscillospiraceae bacterium]